MEISQERYFTLLHKEDLFRKEAEIRFDVKTASHFIHEGIEEEDPDHLIKAGKDLLKAIKQYSKIREEYVDIYNSWVDFNDALQEEEVDG